MKTHFLTDPVLVHASVTFSLTFASNSAIDFYKTWTNENELDTKKWTNENELERVIKTELDKFEKKEWNSVCKFTKIGRSSFVFVRIIDLTDMMTMCVYIYWIKDLGSYTFQLIVAIDIRYGSQTHHSRTHT